MEGCSTQEGCDCFGTGDEQHTSITDDFLSCHATLIVVSKDLRIELAGAMSGERFLLNIGCEVKPVCVAIQPTFCLLSRVLKMGFSFGAHRRHGRHQEFESSIDDRVRRRESHDTQKLDGLEHVPGKISITDPNR